MAADDWMRQSALAMVVSPERISVSKKKAKTIIDRVELPDVGSDYS